MDVRLILNSGKQKGRETPLARGIYLVGRSSICQIRPKNRYVSRKHCAFVHRKRELLIQDLGSTSGTFVNGKRIDPKVAHALKDGDRIWVGKTKFIVAIHSAKPEPSARKKRKAVEQRKPEADEELGLADSDEGKAEETEAEPSGVGSHVNAGAHVIEDVLSMLDEDPDENGDDLDAAERGAPGTQFRLAKLENGEEIDVDDDSDGNVEFAAPRSSESLSEVQPLPSYASRKDWDVQSVYNWVSQKETFARLDQRRAKRKAKAIVEGEPVAEGSTVGLESDRTSEPTNESQMPEQVQAARAKLGSNQSSASKSALSNSSFAWIESEKMRPVVIGAVAVLFLLWLGWNVWLLISFKG